MERQFEKIPLKYGCENDSNCECLFVHREESVVTVPPTQHKNLWELKFEKVFLKYGWDKVPNWECLFANREKGLFLSVSLDDFKLAGKK